MTIKRNIGPPLPRLTLRSGFTLADMAIAVLIVGIMAAVTVPKFSDSIQDVRIEAAARRVVADLEFARRHAEASSTNQAVNFNVVSNSYDLPGVKDIDHSWQDYVVRLSKTGYPAELESVSFGVAGTDSNVIFDIYGRPDYGGSILLRTGDESRTIIVNPATGKAIIQ